MNQPKEIRRELQLLTSVLGAALLVSCAALIGIEDARCEGVGCPGVGNETDSGGSSSTDSGGGSSTDAGVNDPQNETDSGETAVNCESYCALAVEVCIDDTDNDRFERQYNSLESCLEICGRSLFTVPDNERTGNEDSLQCRFELLEDAKTFGDSSSNCAGGGHSGDDICGDLCATYCRFMEDICPDEFLQFDDCEAECDLVPELEVDFNIGITLGDSIQCRLYHIQAAFGNPRLHCEHAAGAKLCVEGDPE